MAGRFITFEGGEGSGKTTQLQVLLTHLLATGRDAVETRDPGGTPIGKQIRSLLLDPAYGGTAAVTELFLYEASRAQLVHEVIRPALAAGRIVLCDRFTDSTVAYQGYGRGLDLDVLSDLNRFATAGLTPDLTLLFDLPVPVGLGRRRRNETEQNRMDREPPRFHERVRQGFLELAARHRRRIRVLDGRPDPETVAMQVRTIVRKFLQRRKRPVTRHNP